MSRGGGVRTIRGHKYMRIRVGEKKRETIPLPACRTDEEAVERCSLIADTANELIAAGRRDKVRDIGVQLGAATSAKVIASILKAVRIIVEQRSVRTVGELTVRQFANMWTSGELHRQYPDHVKDKKKSVRVDKGHLRRRIFRFVGDIPLRAFTLDDAELVMSKIEPSRSPATRRHVAQILVRLFKMAVFPCRLIAASPIPAGFLPKVKTVKALSYLYPSEEARLMACMEVPLVYRVLYGVIAREGLRLSEALKLEWKDVDLVHGTIRLDENKTSEPRTWAMDRSVAATLRRWKGDRETGLVFETDCPLDHLAERFRGHLASAGITRPELFERTSARQPIRIHDLRGTFVTVSLAAGRTEAWVQDRTGHKSSLMIAKYRRVARSLAEVGQTGFAALDVALPDLPPSRAAFAHPTWGNSGATARGDDAGLTITNTLKNKLRGPRGGRTRTSRRTEDFKSSPPVSQGSGSLKNKRDDDDGERAARSLPHPLPHLAKAADHLAHERVTWDLFDLFEADVSERGAS